MGSVLPKPRHKMMLFCVNVIVLITFLRWTGVVEGRLHIGISEGSTSPEGAEGDTILRVNQIRGYWRCYDTVLLRPIRHPNLSTAESENLAFCPATFDGWGCWDATAAGKTAEIHCPDFYNNFEGPEKAYKKCLENGTWDVNFVTKEEIVDYGRCNIKRGDADLLFQVIVEFTSLEKSPYSDPQTAAAFEYCAKVVLAQPRLKLSPGEVYCPRTFDGWGCWNDTLSGTTAYIPCPSFIPGFLPERLAHKECNSDGTWFRHPSNNRTWSNYTTCIDKEDLTFRQRINNIYISGYSTSVVALLISLGIFFYFRIPTMSLIPDLTIEDIEIPSEPQDTVDKSPRALKASHQAKGPRVKAAISTVVLEKLQRKRDVGLEEKYDKLLTNLNRVECKIDILLEKYETLLKSVEP